VTIEVPRSNAAILGRIRWPDGSPASGLIVSGIDRQGNMLWKGTDEDGRFEVRELPAGTFVVQAKTNSDRTEDRMGVVRAEGELQRGQTLELELTLTRRAVRSLGARSDASVRAARPSAARGLRVIHAPNMTMGFGTTPHATDADGRYRFSDLLEGTYQIEIARSAAGLGGATRGVPRSDSQRAEPRRTGLRALQGRVISGWVDPDNLELSELEVADRARERRRRARALARRARTAGSAWMAAAGAARGRAPPPRRRARPHSRSERREPATCARRSA
jgi:hypothetical protein